VFDWLDLLTQHNTTHNPFSTPRSYFSWQHKVSAFTFSSRAYQGTSTPLTVNKHALCLRCHFRTIHGVWVLPTVQFQNFPARHEQSGCAQWLLCKWLLCVGTQAQWPKPRTSAQHNTQICIRRRIRYTWNVSTIGMSRRSCVCDLWSELCGVTHRNVAQCITMCLSEVQRYRQHNNNTAQSLRTCAKPSRELSTLTYSLQRRNSQYTRRKHSIN
jgi:hypothetical protein